MSPQMLILHQSSPKKCRLLGHGNDFQKNIGPVEDSMYYSTLQDNPFQNPNHSTTDCDVVKQGKNYSLPKHLSNISLLTLCLRVPRALSTRSSSTAIVAYFGSRKGSIFVKPNFPQSLATRTPPSLVRQTSSPAQSP